MACFTEFTREPAYLPNANAASHDDGGTAISEPCDYFIWLG